MNYTLVTEYDGKNILFYIEYKNNKKILLDNNEEYTILNDDNYIYYLNNNEIIKIFDINNKIYLSEKTIIQKIYNNYINEINILKKEEKVLKLTI